MLFRGVDRGMNLALSFFLLLLYAQLQGAIAQPKTWTHLMAPEGGSISSVYVSKSGLEFIGSPSSGNYWRKNFTTNRWMLEKYNAVTTSHDNNVIALQGLLDGTLFLKDRHRVYKSTSDGQTWVEDMTSPRMSDRTIRSHDGVFYEAMGTYWYRSMNGFSTVESYNTPALDTIVPGRSGTVYAKRHFDGVLMVSSDYGDAWTDTKLPVLALGVFPDGRAVTINTLGEIRIHDGNQVLSVINSAPKIPSPVLTVGGSGSWIGVMKSDGSGYVSSDQGANWSAIEGIANRQVSKYVVVGDTVYALVPYDGIFRRLYSNAKWESDVQGLYNTNITQVIARPWGAYILAEGLGVYAYDHIIQSFYKITPDSLRSVKRICEGENNDIMIILSDARLYRYDAQLSVAVELPRPTKSISDICYANNKYYAASTLGVTISRDRGLSWERTLCRDTLLDRVYSDPSQRVYAYALNAYQKWRGYINENDGAYWVDLYDKYGMRRLYDVAFSDKTEDGVMFGEYVMLTSDGGRTWRQDQLQGTSFWTLSMVMVGSKVLAAAPPWGLNYYDPVAKSYNRYPYIPGDNVINSLSASGDYLFCGMKNMGVIYGTSSPTSVAELGTTDLSALFQNVYKVSGKYDIQVDLHSQIIVMDASGRVAQKWIALGRQEVVDLSRMPAGVYIALSRHGGRPYVLRMQKY